MSLAALPQQRFRRSLRRAMLAPVLLVVMLACVFLYQIQWLLEQERWVDHTDQVIARANETEKLVLRMQSNVRAFLLTGRGGVPGRFRQTEATARTSAASLTAQVSDNPAQVEQARRIEGVIERARGVNARFLEARRRDAGADFGALLGDDEYRAVVEERDRVFADFIGVEE